MKVPVEWLTEYLEMTSSVEELADALTMAGLEVEDIEHVTASEVVRSGGAADGHDDRALVTKVTPNRGDWLSMIGVAREAAAVTGARFSMPDPKGEGTAPDAPSQIKISITAPDLCRRYAGMIIRNVSIKESPDWMKNRLIRAGMRPINNVVDITNYVLLELGQPLHAFDYDLLKGREIIVRRAREGETITSIDEIVRELHPDMLVIADRDRAVAIAGVMGGFDSEVSPNTKNILLESANFDPVSIRRTSKALNMVTESSYRFERGVDIGITDLAARRAAELMRDLGGGEIAKGVVDIYPGKSEPDTISVRPDRVNWLLGTDLKPEEMVRCLKALGIPAQLMEMHLVSVRRLKHEHQQLIDVTVPTFRPDIQLEADVIEEITRVYGYENIGTTLPSTPLQGSDSPEGLFVERLRGILMACGLQEVLTHSLIDPVTVEVTGMDGNAISVRNPLSEESSKLRPMVAPNLLRVIARNQSVGVKDLGIFEIGKVYRRSEAGGIEEFRSLAGAMAGSRWASAWNLNKEALAADFYLAKGALESLLGRLDIEDVKFSPIEHPLLHPTRAAGVAIGGIEIGILGEIAPDVRERLDVRGRPCVFEIDVEQLMPLVPMAVGYKELARFPALNRHLAIVLRQDVPYADVRNAIVASGRAIIEDVDLLDVYTGPQVGENERSLTLSIVFRSSERTLTDEEIGGVLESVKSRLTAQFSAKFRV